MSSSCNPAGAGTGTHRRAEPGITIALAQISPATVSGTSRSVQPASPCARTRAQACSYDATAATAATPITAPAVDHLMIRPALSPRIADVKCELRSAGTPDSHDCALIARLHNCITAGMNERSAERPFRPGNEQAERVTRTVNGSNITENGDATALSSAANRKVRAFTSVIVPGT